MRLKGSTDLKKKSIFFLKIFISLFLMGWLFSKVDWVLFWRYLDKANGWIISLGILFFGINVFLSILRWKIPLDYFSVKENKKELYILYLIGSFFNNFLPSSVGGDGYKYFALSKKYPDKKKEIFASLFFDRGFGFFCLFFLNIILFPFVFRLVFKTEQLFWFELLMIIFFLVVVIIFIFRNFIYKIIKKLFFQFQFINKFIQLLLIFSNLLKSYLIKPAFFYSILFIGIGAFWQWIYLVAFGVHVNFIYLLFAFTLIQIAGVIPISLNSLGVSEGLSIFLYGFVGVPFEVSLAVALSIRVMLLTLSTLGGILYLVKR